MQAKGESWAESDQVYFKETIRSQYEQQGHPFYATARLWDDGVIDPGDSRHYLSLGLAACMNAPIDGTQFGVLRM